MEFVVQPRNEGDSIVIRNGIGGTASLKYLDPFVLFSDITLSNQAGYSDHPHRGFDSFTYVLEGAVAYKDWKGHEATINPGDIQWVKTGRGTIHSEKGGVEGVITRAIQVWINVPSLNKMDKPECIEISNKHIAERKHQTYTVRTMANSLELGSLTKTPITISEYELDPTAHLSLKLPEGWNAFAYVLEGEGVFGPSAECEEPSKPHTLVVIPNSQRTLRVHNKSSKSNMRFLLFAGEPINEPMVQHGPFVMNTQEEIDETIQDYRSRRNGFEEVVDSLV